eukprot:gene16714-biopygen9808
MQFTSGQVRSGQVGLGRVVSGQVRLCRVSQDPRSYWELGFAALRVHMAGRGIFWKDGHPILPKTCSAIPGSPRTVTGRRLDSDWSANETALPVLPGILGGPAPPPKAPGTAPPTQAPGCLGGGGRRRPSLGIEKFQLG